MSESDLLLFVVGGVITAIAFWGAIAYGIISFQQWQARQEVEAAREVMADEV